MAGLTLSLFSTNFAQGTNNINHLEAQTNTGHKSVESPLRRCMDDTNNRPFYSFTYFYKFITSIGRFMSLNNLTNGKILFEHCYGIRPVAEFELH